MPEVETQFRVSLGDEVEAVVEREEVQHRAGRVTKRSGNSDHFDRSRLQQGQILLTVWVKDNDLDRAVTLFEQFGAGHTVID